MFQDIWSFFYQAYQQVAGNWELLLKSASIGITMLTAFYAVYVSLDIAGRFVAYRDEQQGN